MIKIKYKFSSLVKLATFQVRSSHTWLLTTILDRTDREHFHHHTRITPALLRAEEMRLNISLASEIPKMVITRYPAHSDDALTRLPTSRSSSQALVRSQAVLVARKLSLKSISEV